MNGDFTVAVRGWRFAARGSVIALMFAAACGGPNGPGPLPDAPTAACPANVSVAAVVGGTQDVSYALPAITGGTPPVGITCTPGSGTSFPVGTTTVLCVATDASSRTAQCTFTVTLTAALSLGATKFLAFGDSVTEGQNGRLTLRGDRVVDVPNSYPTQLATMLNAEYVAQPITVVNRGYGGKTADELRQILPGDLRQVHPDAVLLLGGYNDLRNSCAPQDATTSKCASATTEVAAGVRKMVVSSKEAAIKYIFVSTLTPPGPYGGGGFDRRIAASAIVTTNNKLVAMVRAEAVTLVDPYSVFIGHEPEYIDQDGLHLRPAGNQALAETFFAAIKTTIASTPALTH
jgi:lysophospholipase L1-like esterase